eukprot:TRINITY_DN4176_c0_g1_i13.p1 TRINITY_DN4176_c0_g1~~TRINITY_DN4176_c0_g1_i13.p1  ORF type:complete len:145 (-),score=16.83 TRINITY_DN4176_c0_g1_i13:129-563(-)
MGQVVFLNNKNALAIGWGFGFTSVMLSYVSGLSHATGPGFLAAPACSQLSIFYVLAYSQLGFVMLHFLFSFLAFDGYNGKAWWKPLVVFLVHFATSLMTWILNSSMVGNCMSGSVISTFLFLLVMFVLVGWNFTRENTLLRSMF